MQVIFDNIIPILASTITMSIPLIFASVGGAFSVRSGVMALGLESMMMVGAFCSVLGTYLSSSVTIGFLSGIAGGALIGLLHALFSVRYRMNQVISGIGLNLLATAATTLLMQLIWGNKGASPLVNSVDKTVGGFITKIPFLGDILGRQSFNVFVAAAVVFLGWFVLFKTRFGLRLRMVGENPKAASSVGLRAHALKYSGVLICGVLAGYGGAFLAIDQLNIYVREMSAGRGYIAVVITILGRYNPPRIVLGALLFGFCDALQIYLQNSGVPTQLIQMLPYVVTLLVLAFGVQHIVPPAGVGKHIDE